MRHDYLLQFFEYKHLPPNLQNISIPFHDLAHGSCARLPANPELTAMLRKLLEAKDCAVRAAIFKEPPLDEETIAWAKRVGPSSMADAFDKLAKNGGVVDAVATQTMPYQGPTGASMEER